MTTRQRTQVAIIGAGPAGLVLGQTLTQAGVDNVLLEARSAEHVSGRIRAGVLEPGTVRLLQDLGIGPRMLQHGLSHQGFELAFHGDRLRIDFSQLAGGQTVTIYGQTEVTRDLMAARSRAGLDTVYEAANVSPSGFDGARPQVSYEKNGEHFELTCDYIAGCDGFHGVCRPSIPSNRLTVYEREFPVAWLGLLSDTPPVSAELLYAHHERGFALCSMRSRHRSRYYIQCPQSTTVGEWSDEAFWNELRLRLPTEFAEQLVTGVALEKSVTPLRSFVVEPMRFGRLFLAGDAAHIVPPTGAKGLNLAAMDALRLGTALAEQLIENTASGLDHYCQQSLRRVWSAQRFTAWLTRLTHQWPGQTPTEKRLQRAEFDTLRGSLSAATSLAEGYLGLL